MGNLTVWGAILAAFLCCAMAPAQERGRPADASTCRMRGLAAGTHTVSEQDLLRAYNAQASEIRTLEASAVIRGRSGVANKAYRKESKPSGAMITFRAPGLLRMTGEVPMSAQRSFDLVSDGRAFELLVPDGKGMRLFEGPVDAPAVSANPRENLRPQPLIDALRWPDAKPQTTKSGAPNPPAGTIFVETQNANPLGVSAEVKFDLRAGVVRQLTLRDQQGKVTLQADYDQWQPTSEGGCYPRHMLLTQPEEKTQLELKLVSLFLNQRISGMAFRAIAPPGVPVTQLTAVERETRP